MFYLYLSFQQVASLSTYIHITDKVLLVEKMYTDSLPLLAAGTL